MQIENSLYWGLNKLQLIKLTMIRFCFYTRNGFFAAASFMSFQQCRFNFGASPFRFPPDRPFDCFNAHAELPEQDKVVLPRHIFLQQLRKQSVREDSCTLCFDNQGTVRIEPCKHKWVVGMSWAEIMHSMFDDCLVCSVHTEDSASSVPPSCNSVRCAEAKSYWPFTTIASIRIRWRYRSFLQSHWQRHRFRRRRRRRTHDRFQLLPHAQSNHSVFNGERCNPITHNLLGNVEYKKCPSE